MDALTHVLMGLEVLTSPSSLSLVLLFSSTIKCACAFVFLLSNVCCGFHFFVCLFGAFCFSFLFFMFQFLKSMTE